MTSKLISMKLKTAPSQEKSPHAYSPLDRVSIPSKLRFKYLQPPLVTSGLKHHSRENEHLCIIQGREDFPAVYLLMASYLRVCRIQTNRVSMRDSKALWKTKPKDATSAGNSFNACKKTETMYVFKIVEAVEC